MEKKRERMRERRGEGGEGDRSVLSFKWTNYNVMICPLSLFFYPWQFTLIYDIRF